MGWGGNLVRALSDAGRDIDQRGFENAQFQQRQTTINRELDLREREIGNRESSQSFALLEALQVQERREMALSADIQALVEQRGALNAQAMSQSAAANNFKLMGDDLAYQKASQELEATLSLMKLKDQRIAGMSGQQDVLRQQGTQVQQFLTQQAAMRDVLGMGQQMQQGAQQQQQQPAGMEEGQAQPGQPQPQMQQQGMAQEPMPTNPLPGSEQPAGGGPNLDYWRRAAEGAGLPIADAQINGNRFTLSTPDPEIADQWRERIKAIGTRTGGVPPIDVDDLGPEQAEEAKRANAAMDREQAIEDKKFGRYTDVKDRVGKLREERAQVEKLALPNLSDATAAAVLGGLANTSSNEMVKAIATAARDAGPETRKELVRILKESYDAIIGDAEIEQAEVEPEVRGKFGIKKLGMEAFVRKWLEARSLDPKNLTPDQNAKLKAAWAKYNGE